MAYSFTNDHIFWFYDGSESEMDVWIVFGDGEDVGACFPMATPSTGAGINVGSPKGEVMTSNFRKAYHNTLEEVSDSGTIYLYPEYSYTVTVTNTGGYPIFFNLEG
jgi:hypothetical protein